MRTPEKRHKAPKCEEYNSFHNNIMIFMSTFLFLGFYFFVSNVISSKTLSTNTILIMFYINIIFIALINPPIISCHAEYVCKFRSHSFLIFKRSLSPWNLFPINRCPLINNLFLYLSVFVFMILKRNYLGNVLQIYS